MIDRDARDRLALALRRLAAGRITNVEFDDEAWAKYCDRADDSALAELSNFGWLHYSDHYSYRLRGRHALSREERRGISRAILFLKTNQEYVHGESLTSGTCLSKSMKRGVVTCTVIALIAGAFTYFALNTFVLGLLLVLMPAYLGMFAFVSIRNAFRRRRCPPLPDTFWPYLDERASQEQYRFWPFENERSYANALANPPFLCGVRAP